MQEKLSKLASFLKEYFPHVILSIILIRVTLVGAGIGDALVALGITALCGYHRFTNTETIKWRDIVTKEIQEVKQFISSFKVSMSMGDKQGEQKPKSGQPRRYF